MAILRCAVFIGMADAKSPYVYGVLIRFYQVGLLCAGFFKNDDLYDKSHIYVSIDCVLYAVESV